MPVIKQQHCVIAQIVGVTAKLQWDIEAVAASEWSASRSSRFDSRGKSCRYPLDKRLGGRGGEE
jgi:hypothetical protein